MSLFDLSFGIFLLSCCSFFSGIIVLGLGRNYNVGITVLGICLMILGTFLFFISIQIGQQYTDQTQKESRDYLQKQLNELNQTKTYLNNLPCKDLELWLHNSTIGKLNSTQQEQDYAKDLILAGCLK